MATLMFHFEQIPQGEDDISGGNTGFLADQHSVSWEQPTVQGASLLPFCHCKGAAPTGVSVVQVCYDVGDLKSNWKAEGEKGEQSRVSREPFHRVQKQWLGLAVGAGYSNIMNFHLPPRNYSHQVVM